MKKLQALRKLFSKGYNFELDLGTTIGITPQFKTFSSKFKSAIKEQVELAGGKLEKFNRGHFDVSGFFTSPSGKPYYFAISDVRCDYQEKVCFRKCEQIGSYKNHEFNQWCELEELHKQIERL